MPAFKRLAILVCLATTAAGFSHELFAQAQKQAAQAPPKPAEIDRNGVLILIRSVLIALDQGNKTGNYTVLRDLGAPGFQNNSAARLAEIFAGQRRDNVDLSGVTVLDPQLSLLPQIEANGMLHMAGFFPSVPLQVNFELMFAPVDSRWRLFGISVNVGQSGPVAPPPSPPPTEPPKAQAKAPTKSAASKTPPKAPKSIAPPGKDDPGQ